jgi:triosephosphate isomerase
VLIGSSLKMYFGRARTVEWTRAVADICAAHPAVREGLVEPFVIPSFVSIAEVMPIARTAGMLVGAQDVHWAEPGPYTGEVSAAELAEHGVSLVEIGHAERRAHFGETDDTVARKTAAVVRHGLTPLLCIGEAVESDPTRAAEVCTSQLESSLARVDGSLANRLVVAYEPVWAIGRSDPADDEHIRLVTRAIKTALVATPFSAQVIYGGSARPGLLPRIGDAVDGVFLGRFAHDPLAFGGILDEALDMEEMR